MTKKLLLLAALLILLFSLAGCQTIAGLGEDITWTADATADVLEGE